MTRRRKGASDSCFYYKWLDKALCDLQAARLLLTYGGDHYNIAFHCQQAIEKALKGYLLFRTGRHFDGHNLTYLCRQAIQLDSKASPNIWTRAQRSTIYILRRGIQPTCRLRLMSWRSAGIWIWRSGCSPRFGSSCMRAGDRMRLCSADNFYLRCLPNELGIGANP